MGSTRVIKVPDVGEGIAEVELVAWHVAPADMVAEDQALADVMTDKASVEIPSPVAGVVQALGGAVGQMLAVGAELIRIEPVAAVQGPGGTPGPVPASAPAPAVEAAVEQPVAPVPPPAAMDAPAVAMHHPTSAPAGTRADRPIASPAVRRRAWEAGVDLADLRPSGPAGRVLQADLDAWIAAHPPTQGRHAALGGPPIPQCRSPARRPALPRRDAPCPACPLRG